jgi:DNA-binding winged helix-turn-helix (wHTH) protein
MLVVKCSINTANRPRTPEEPRNVPESPNQNRVFRFGTYELDAGTGELRKDGKTRPRLQGQPLEILLHLLDHPSEVVTREELRQRLWPADTFVDYDHSLNTAVNKLREALNDSADNPRFIQTIPRRGYRFVAPVETIDGAQGSANPEGPRKPVAAPTINSEARTSMLSDPRELPRTSRPVVRFLFSLIQVMYFCFYVISLASVHRVDAFLSRELQHPAWVFIPLLVTASVGIPIRLYLLTAALFGYSGLTSRFLKLFPVLFLLDELWALSPFLAIDQIGAGLALAATAALLYVPFSQRSLLLMGESNPKHG